jgi:hypothetical protein
MRIVKSLAGAFFVVALPVAGLVYCPAPTAWACGVNESPDLLCSNEQQFVNDLAAHGISSTQSPRRIANLGWQICGDIQQGRSPDVEANRVYAYNTDLGGDGAHTVVTVAVADLCPQASAPHYLPPNYQPRYNLP